MWNLINAPETEIFGIAIALMVLLGVLEVISCWQAVSATGWTTCCPTV